MKIWVIARSYPTIQNKLRGSFEFEQAKLLAANGHEVVYLALVFHPLHKIKKWWHCHWTESGVRIYTYSQFFTPDRVNLHLPWYKKRKWSAFLSYVEQLEGIPDVIHIHYPSMITHPDAVLPYKKRNVKIVVTEHWSKVLLHTVDSCEKAQLQRYAAEADVFSCVGEPLSSAVRDLTDTQRKLPLLPNMVSSLFQPSFREQKEDLFQFVSVGRLRDVKQFDKVIEAFAGISSQYNAKLVIVGNGREYEKLKKLIDSLGMNERIVLMGAQPREEVAKIVAASNALICYSQFETFGVPVIEAWACGIPVIASESLGFLEYWRDDLGYLVSHKEVDALIQAMERMLQHKNSGKKEAIAEYAVSMFGEEATYERLMEIYDD